MSCNKPNLKILSGRSILNPYVFDHEHLLKFQILFIANVCSPCNPSKKWVSSTGSQPNQQSLDGLNHG